MPPEALVAKVGAEGAPTPVKSGNCPPGGYDMGVAALVKSIEELQERVDKCSHPRTVDDVSITSDGRRLDTKEKVLAFLEELDVERAAHAPEM